MNETSRILIIIPTYNEKSNINALLSAILKQADKLDVLIVDDNSPDGTAQVIRRDPLYNKRVYLIERSGKLGLGTAYITGFRWALKKQYDYIMEMDADFSHNPAALPEFLKQTNQADALVGSRYIPGGCVVNWPWYRRWLSQGAGIYVRFLTGLPLADPTSGFKCYSKKVLENLDLEKITAEGYGFQIEIMYHIWQRHFLIKEIPITFVDRLNGRSKMSWNIAFQAFGLVLKLGLKRFHLS